MGWHGSMFALLGLALLSAEARADSTAFYYGRDVPEELLRVYERVVVEPDAIADPARLHGRRARLVAYASVGEVADTARTRPEGMTSDWTLGRNGAWNSQIMDLTNPAWTRWLVDRRMRDLWRQGYRGFFLDTLDSFRLADLSADEQAAQLDALVALIQRMHRRYPGVEILLNRGFEVLPRVAHLVHGVVAESLFDRWDAANNRYARVPENDRRWLLDALRQVEDRHGLPVTVIDYRPPSERAQARETARRIEALGFDPWVTNASIDMVGVGVPEVVPRRVLLLFDGAQEEPALAAGMRLLAPILEHEGYVPVLRDVRARLPTEPLPGRYAGIATWLPGPVQGDPAAYARWLLAQMDDGVRVAMLGHPGFALDAAALARLGLKQVLRPPSHDLELRYSDMLGFEAPPRAHRVLATGLIADDPWLEVHLRVADEHGPRLDPVITGAWGGLAQAPYFLEQDFGGELAWVIDPFAFVRAALALPAVPVPDLTTESGHRLLMIHVDPAGAERRAEVRGTPRAAALVRQVMARHRLPHTTSSRGLARGLEHVTVADSMLAGQGASLTHAMPSITRLVPSARPARHGGIEVLAPIADEDGFRVIAGAAPFGFRRVLETLDLTDRARRLAPIALRYHAFSGATPAGLAALERVYSWIAARPTLPVHAGEYADMVRDFRDLALARYPDGAFRIHGGGALRTVRLPRALGWPDLARSPAVAAVRDLPQGRYVTVDAASAAAGAILTMRDEPPALPFILGSNARVLRFERQGAAQIRLHLRGHVPVSVVIANLPAKGCVLRGRGFAIEGRRADGPSALRFDLPARDPGPAILHCET